MWNEFCGLEGIQPHVHIHWIDIHIDIQHRPVFQSVKVGGGVFVYVLRVGCSIFHRSLVRIDFVDDRARRVCVKPLSTFPNSFVVPGASGSVYYITMRN